MDEDFVNFEGHESKSREEVDDRTKSVDQAGKAIL